MNSLENAESMSKEELIVENRKLFQALNDLIAWSVPNQEGLAWATDDAKKRNREMCNQAIESASELFPVNFNGFNQ